jgi:hypothetical protein
MLVEPRELSGSLEQVTATTEANTWSAPPSVKARTITAGSGSAMPMFSTARSGGYSRRIGVEDRYGYEEERA